MLKATSSIVNVSQITGVLPVVNGGTGVTTSTGTGNTVLSAAPTLSGNVTLSTGNLIVASGQGIDFSATANPGGMTSELFSDYEEGTWTPTVTSASGVVTLVDATGSIYTKIGRTVQVTVRFGISTDALVGTSDLTIGGLPYAVNGFGSGLLTYSNASSLDFGTGGANGAIYANSSSLFHISRTVNISSRSTFYWFYYATYTAN
jgi:hypothetical protein